MNALARITEMETALTPLGAEMVGAKLIVVSAQFTAPRRRSSRGA